MVVFHAGSKTFYLNKNYKTHDEAKEFCNSRNMALARLETKTEHDYLISTFKNKIDHQDGEVAWLGISLAGEYIVDEESKKRLPYVVNFSVGYPDGDGNCLKVSRFGAGGKTGISNDRCTLRWRFICEKGEIYLSSEMKIENI